jgi:hypothetical protein
MLLAASAVCLLPTSAVCLLPTSEYRIARGRQNKLRVTENMVQRVFGPKGKDETGCLVNKRDETLQDLQLSLSIIRMIEAGMMGWEGNLSHLLGEIYTFGFLVGKSEGKVRLEYTGK